MTLKVSTAIGTV